MRPIRVLPSLLSADFARLADELARCAAAGASMVHVDVMDGHFVPNLTVGPVVVAAMVLLPVAGNRAPLSFAGDMILFAYYLGLMRFFTVLAALDTDANKSGVDISDVGTAL